MEQLMGVVLLLGYHPSKGVQSTENGAGRVRVSAQGGMRSVDHLQGVQHGADQTPAVRRGSVVQLQPSNELRTGCQGLKQRIQEAGAAEIVKSGYLAATLAQAGPYDKREIPYIIHFLDVVASEDRHRKTPNSPEGPQKTKAPTTAATVTPAAIRIFSLSIGSWCPDSRAGGG